MHMANLLFSMQTQPFRRWEFPFRVNVKETVNSESLLLKTMSKQNTSIWKNKHILTLYSNKVPVRSSTAALLWVGCYHLVSAKLCMYSTLKLKMPSVQKKWFFKVLEDKLLVIYRFNAGCLEEHKKNNGIAYGCVTGVKTSKLELRNLWGCRPRTRITWASLLGL